jgi:hypothetical protein
MELAIDMVSLPEATTNKGPSLKKKNYEINLICSIEVQELFFFKKKMSNWPQGEGEGENQTIDL